MAGGAVRNALLGEPVADVDIATTLSPEAVMSGRECRWPWRSSDRHRPWHGDAGLRSQRPFEVTTLRHDVETDGRRAKVAFTDDWAGGCAAARLHHERALLRRGRENIIDFAMVTRTCLRRRIRFVGTPSQRIREDYLRILRFFRFHARYR